MSRGLQEDLGVYSAMPRVFLNGRRFPHLVSRATNLVARETNLVARETKLVTRAAPALDPSHAADEDCLCGTTAVCARRSSAERRPQEIESRYRTLIVLIQAIRVSKRSQVGLAIANRLVCRVARPPRAARGMTRKEGRKRSA